MDNHIACVGGLDFSLGRWDTHNHSLADVHLTDNMSRTLWPGKDYYDTRIADVEDAADYVDCDLSITDTPRMPWHDVSLSGVDVEFH